MRFMLLPMLQELCQCENAPRFSEEADLKIGSIHHGIDKLPHTGSFKFSVAGKIA